MPAECLQEGGFSLSRAVARITALIKVFGVEDASMVWVVVLCADWYSNRLDSQSQD